MSVQYNPKTGGRGIEWTTETRNATGGCMHDCKWQMPDGTIAGCYAKDLAENGVAAAGYPHGFEHHYFRPKAIAELTRGKSPLLIFCDSMSDMFSSSVPREHVTAILGAMHKAPHHAYQSLTKAAPMLLQYLKDLPPNLWVGVSSPPDFFKGKQLNLHQQKAMLKRSLDVLAEVKAKTGNIVWMSAEPVSWDLTTVIGQDHPLDWIVIGAASDGRRYFQPDPTHIRNLLNVVDQTATPVFYKGNIKPMFKANDLGSPALNRWREDLPATYRDGSAIPAVVARQKICARLGWTQNTFIQLEQLSGAKIPSPQMSLPVLSI